MFHEDVAGEIVGKALQAGLILNAVRPNAVRFMPPLTVTQEEIDRAASILEAVIADVTG